MQPVVSTPDPQVGACDRQLSATSPRVEVPAEARLTPSALRQKPRAFGLANARAQPFPEGSKVPSYRIYRAFIPGIANIGLGGCLLFGYLDP